MIIKYLNNLTKNDCIKTQKKKNNKIMIKYQFSYHQVFLYLFYKSCLCDRYTNNLRHTV